MKLIMKDVLVDYIVEFVNRIDNQDWKYVKK